MNEKKMNPFRMQQILVLVSIVLFVVKMVAWWLTSSVAILTDALEGSVNVIAGFIGLYSLAISSKPRDKEHPYGHGKVEFLTSAIEGILITIAGFVIIYEGLNNFIHPHVLKSLDFGLILVAISGLVNYLVGYYCVKKGKEENSPVLVASGSHLISDTYSSLGLLLGVGLILLTGYNWIDSITAIVFAFIIIFTGYKIIRKAISGMMDEADDTIIDQIVKILNENRNHRWVDVHNMRVIDYAGFYHIDCHLTVPYYINVNEAHEVLDTLTNLFKQYFDNKVEFFIHVDGCIPNSQCSICAINNCPKRESNFVAHVHWTHENILSNNKHSLNYEKNN